MRLSCWDQQDFSDKPPVSSCTGTRSLIITHCCTLVGQIEVIVSTRSTYSTHASALRQHISTPHAALTQPL
ncbi:hypothetical protein BGX38DRAFT_1170625 [Terfezia claveryi]|nr:hypothetical protein BGX38DRAFT_1170625 [Terfezia claveryi]